MKYQRTNIQRDYVVEKKAQLIFSLVVTAVVAGAVTGREAFERWGK